MEVRQLREAYFDHDFSPPANNRSFWQSRMPGGNPRYYFMVENAVLKQISDRIYKDKSVAASLLIMYKKIFYEELAKIPDTSIHKSWLTGVEFGGVYSDFKVDILAYEIKDPSKKEQLNQGIQSFYFKVATRFANTLKNEYPEIHAKVLGQAGLVGHPGAWSLGAMSHDPRLAYLKARQMRKEEPEARYTKDHPDLKLIKPEEADDFTRYQAAATLKDAEKSRLELRKMFNNHSDFFADDGLLTISVIDILRRVEADPSVVTVGEYIHAIRKRFEKRFGFYFPQGREGDDQILKLLKYFRQANELVPPVRIFEPESLTLIPGKISGNGLMTFDLSGQNNRNLREAMASMRAAVTKHKTGDELALVDDYLNIAYDRQMRESERFNVRMAKIKIALRETGLYSEADIQRMSGAGDDRNLPVRITLEQQALTIDKIVELQVAADGVRSTYQPPAYEDTGNEISRVNRLALSSRAEDLEKLVRSRIEGRGQDQVSYANLRGLGIGIRIHPLENYSAKVKHKAEILIATKEPLTPEAKQEIRRKIRNVLNSEPDENIPLEVTRILFTDDIRAGQASRQPGSKQQLPQQAPADKVGWLTPLRSVFLWLCAILQFLF